MSSGYDFSRLTVNHFGGHRPGFSFEQNSASCSPIGGVPTSTAQDIRTPSLQEAIEWQLSYSECLPRDYRKTLRGSQQHRLETGKRLSVQTERREEGTPNVVQEALGISRMEPEFQRNPPILPEYRAGPPLTRLNFPL